MIEARPLRVILEVRSGTDAARSIVIEGATPRTLGRSAVADERFPHDPYMNDLHASLWIDGDTCFVRDLGTTYGTWINERGVQQSPLTDGDLLQIGGTQIVFRIARSQPVAVPVERPSFETRVDHVMWFLRSGPGAIYAILDAARDEQVLPFLYKSGMQFQSLYEGLRGEELALVAPYLVAFTPDAPSLVALVAERWGESWGVFLRADASFRDVRRHLRRLLRVELDDGEQVLFRFYDPRVLRAYLPTCTVDEAAQVYGPIAQYITEGRRGETALRFTPSADGVRVDTETLTSVESSPGAL